MQIKTSNGNVSLAREHGDHEVLEARRIFACIQLQEEDKSKDRHGNDLHRTDSKAEHEAIKETKSDKFSC